MKTTAWLKLGCVAALAALSVSCAIWRDRQEKRRANSLYNYLYAAEAGHRDVETIPRLSLPLRVGMAFVPGDRPKGSANYTSREDAGFTENQKMDLMKQISGEFKSYPFIKSVELVPTAYLVPRGGFANLDQIRTMYGVDVMVLLSYDQVQFTDEGLLSLTYWTIVGAYVIQGEKNDTQTMLDGAVYDIASRKLLFRAPGISAVKGSATPVNLTEQLRRDSDKGFKESATNLVAGLKVQLDDFRERVKNAPDQFQVVNKPGYTGGSGLGEVEMWVTAALGVCFWWTRRNRAVVSG